MATCSVCNASISLREGYILTADELRQAVALGFTPPEEVLARAVAAGLSREQVIARWKQAMAARADTNWVLCSSCAARATAALAVRKPGRPAGRPSAPAAPPAPAKEVSPFTRARNTAPIGGAPSVRYEDESTAKPLSNLERPHSAATVELPPEGPLPRRRDTPLLPMLGMLIVLLGSVLSLPLLRSCGAPPAVAVRQTLPPTRPIIRPTATPTVRPTLAVTTTSGPPDLSNALVLAEDLPSEFVPLSGEEVAQMGLSKSDLEKSLVEDTGLAQAHINNLVFFAYESEAGEQWIIAFLIYPLTEAEQADFDQTILMKSPWLGITRRPGLTLQQLLGFDHLGDASGAVSMIDTSQEPALHMEEVVARRGPVVQAYYYIRTGEQRPLFDLRQLVETVDARVKEALEARIARSARTPN